MKARSRSATWRHVLAAMRDRRASVSIIGAASLTILIGMTGFSVELGNAYTKRVANQAVADTAALSGALSYMNNSNDSKAFQAAKNVARAAGVPVSAVTVTRVTSRRNASSQAIHVEIRTAQQVYLARVLGVGASFDVVNMSEAEIGGGDPACIIALSGTATTGVSVSNSSSITATGCSVASNGAISAANSGAITAKSVTSGSTITTSNSGTVTTTPTASATRQNVANAASDPLSGNAALSAELAKIGTGSPPAAGTVPTGTNFALPSSGATYLFGTNLVVYNVLDGKWHAPPGTYNIRNLSVSSSQNLVFDENPLIPTTLTFSRNIDVSNSSSLVIGAADIYSTGALNVSNSSSVTIGAGRHYFGSINVNSSTSLVIGDGALSVNGDVTVASSATFKVGAATDQYINGNFSVANSSVVQLGAGRYYVNGAFGGTNSASYSGTGVSIFASGAINVTNSGSSSLSPPLSDGGTGIGNIAFASLTSNSSSLGSSGTAPLTGIVYLPNSALSIVNSGNLGSSSGCLILVAAQITNVNSGKIQTNCSSLSSAFGSSGGISLVS